MYLKIMKYKNGRTYLSIAHGYRDKQRGVSTNKTIQKLGYLDELQKEYDDPIDHFKKAAAQMTEKAEEERLPRNISFAITERLGKNTNNRKNIGYAPLSRIYHEIGLEDFFKNRSRNIKTNYNLNDIAKLLVFSRILDPSSKKKTFEGKGKYFESFDFSLSDVYRSLTYFAKHIEACQQHINEHIPNRNTEIVYYDLTNYYFEIDEQDTLRRKGVSKEHRSDPIIQMGLFEDSDGIPISYKLFPGNTNDCETLIPQTRELRRDFSVGRVIVVADKGINTAKNCYYSTHNLQNGYVFSQTVRGGHKELKDYVLEQSGYRVYNKSLPDDNNASSFKIKSRIFPREIEIENADGKKFKTRIDEKQVVFYSNDYDKKAKADRAAAVQKARQMAENPAQYNRATSYGAAKYVKNIEFDLKTGEILTLKQKPVFDEAKLREEEQWDGYYAILTSELDKTDEEIIEIYRGLWRIEESFKVTKSDLETRPVYVTREDHIQAHFLICFISLVIVRLLQKNLKHKFSIPYIIESLSNTSCSYLGENLYLFDYSNDVTDAICAEFGIDFNLKIRTLGDIKKIIANTKKV